MIRVFQIIEIVQRQLHSLDSIIPETEVNIMATIIFVWLKATTLCSVVHVRVHFKLLLDSLPSQT